MTDVPYPSAPPLEKDRRTGLIVFGIFALVIGGLSACLAMFTPLAILMARAMPQQPGMQQANVRNVLAAVVVYVVVAAVFIAGGVGSIRARRWSRPLMLSVAWTWLLMGLFAFAFWLVFAPSMMEVIAVGSPGAPAPPPAFGRMFLVVMSVITGMLYIVLPGVFILFYRSPHVRATVEFYDPSPGWADRAPVPVFGLSVALAVTALLTLTMLFYGFFPLFDRLLTGPAGAAATMFTCAVFAAAAWLTFGLRMSGWWLTMLISIVLPVSMIVSHIRIGPIAMYQRMGVPPEQLDVMRDSAAVAGPVIPACIAVLGVAGILYLLYVRRHFTPTPPPSPPAAAPPA